MQRRKGLARKTGLKTKAGLNRYAKLIAESKDDVAQCKKRIQALLRELAISRDNGCVLRHYPEAGRCGSYRKDGELILQAEHLVTRAYSVSYGDMLNIVCLCRSHHGQWKPQHSRLYWELIERSIGSERWNWLKRVEAAYLAGKPVRMSLWDWQKIEMTLRRECGTNDYPK